MAGQIETEDFRSIISQNLPWNRLFHTTVLVTGANGFIPSYIVKTLMYLNDSLQSGIKIVGLVRNKNKAQEIFKNELKRNDFSLIVQDVSDPITWKGKVQYIIHAASQASPKYYKVDPMGTLKPNIFGTYNLIEFARKNLVKSMLFVSAGEIYGIMKTQGKTDEKSMGILDPYTLRSCYAESKRMGETICQAAFNQYKIPVKLVRLYHTYGPGVRFDDGRVFADFVSNIVNNEDIVLKSDGSAVRSFIYLVDTISGMFTALLKGKNGEAYNLANETSTVSIKSLAETLAQLYPEKKLKVIRKQRPLNDGYVESTISVNRPSTAKLEALGWKPHFSLQEGFRRTIQASTKKRSL